MKLFLFTCACLVGLSIQAQTRLSAEVLGASGAGVSLNGERLITLNSHLKTGLQLGTGLALSGQSKTQWLYKGGVHLYYKNWGLGADATSFNRLGEKDQGSFGETILLVYPNLNYNWYFHAGWFAKFSLGPALSYNQVINPEINPEQSTANYWTRSPFIGLSLGKVLESRPRKKSN